jgi:hypothetical protein
MAEKKDIQEKKIRVVWLSSKSLDDTQAALTPTRPTVNGVRQRSGLLYYI